MFLINELCLELLKECNFPIAAPSANFFTHLSPTSPFMLAQKIQEQIDGVLQGGKCTIGIESTIVYPKEKEVLILRPGAISQKEMSQVLKKDISIRMVSSNDFLKEKNLNAPGLSKKHYAPSIPLMLILSSDKFLYQETIEESIFQSFLSDFSEIYYLAYNEDKKKLPFLYKIYRPFS